MRARSTTAKVHLLVFNLQRIAQEDGQDIVEYVLVVALLAFGITAAMHTLASTINGALTNMASKLSIA